MQNASLGGAVLLAAVAVTASLVPLVRMTGRRLGVLDLPGHRKVHDTPTPRLGGVAVFLGFTSIVGLGYLGAPAFTDDPIIQSALAEPAALLRTVRQVGDKLVAVLLGGAVVFLVGLLDDILGERFPVWAKFLGQILAGYLLIAAGVHIQFLPWPWLNWAVTMLWVVGITNAFNLLDNMDGLSAGVALIACAVLFANAWILDEYFISLLLLAFMGALAGFLLYNWHPASIFLGDCGSLFIGFTMASLTLLERFVSHASGTMFPVLMPVVLLAVPIVDTTTVVVIRLRERRPIYVGDKSHLSHQLRAVGLSTREAVGLLYLVTLSLGLGAISLADATLVQALLVLLQSVGFVLVFLSLVFVHRRRPVPS